jgi:hypothetical protein
MISGGELNAHALEQIASQSGKTPDEVRATAAALVEAFTEQAANAVEKSTGINFDTFVELAKQHNPDALRGAMQRQAFDRSTAGYVEAAKDIVANLDRLDPEAVKAAVSDTGVTVRWLPNGRAVVRAPGKSEQLWSVAIRQGTIKVSR